MNVNNNYFIFIFFISLCTPHRVLIVSERKKYCKRLNHMSSTAPIAEWLEGHAGKQGVRQEQTVVDISLTDLQSTRANDG